MEPIYADRILHGTENFPVRPKFPQTLVAKTLPSPLRRWGDLQDRCAARPETSHQHWETHVVAWPLLCDKFWNECASTIFFIFVVIYSLVDTSMLPTVRSKLTRVLITILVTVKLVLRVTTNNDSIWASSFRATHWSE